MTDISELSNPNRKRYFIYLCRTVRIEKCSRHIKKSYERVAEILHQEAFYVSNGIENDWNRAEDAYQFRREYLAVHPDATDDLVGPVSVLEMMVALSVRIEDIMKSLSGKNQIPIWFNIMMENLGLLDLDDENTIDHMNEVVGTIIERALMREYDYYGNGNFWTCLRPKTDMKCLEIWFQMLQYMNERMGYL